MAPICPSGLLCRKPNVWSATGFYAIIQGRPQLERKKYMTNREELLRRISIDPQVCFGKPCIRGTRIWVSLIVDNLAEGMPRRLIGRVPPTEARDDIRAALAFAAEMTRERIIPIPLRGGQMKLKLDENFDLRLVSLLVAEGYEVDTAPSEGLSGHQRRDDL